MWATFRWTRCRSIAAPLPRSMNGVRRPPRRWLAGAFALVFGFPTLTASAQLDVTCLPQLNDFRALAANASAADSQARRTSMEVCINRRDSLTRDSAVAKTDAEALRLVKIFFEIPEFHDEGRLPATNDLSNHALLGPFAGIFASPFVHGFRRPGQIYEQGMPGLMAALIVVDSQKGDVMPESYKRLQLANGLNCIWLYLPPPAAGSTYNGVLTKDLPFQAYVTHPPAGSKCDRTVSLSAPLSVVPVQAAMTADSTYPPFARFDVDSAGWPVFGFRCLNAFCEVGTSKGKTRRPLDIPPGGEANVNVPETARKVSVIKGWHDEQVLAIRDQAGVWRQSGARAHITPEPAAANYDSASFDHKWQRVATLFIHDLDRKSKYAVVWHLANGANEVWFQFDGKQWLAEIRRDTTIANRRVTLRHPMRYMTRTPHYDVAVPADVRFRWASLDDGVWAPCGQACCKAGDGS